MRRERACEKSSQEKEKNVTIQAIWDRIEAWLKQYAPEEFSSLQPGATDQDIQEAETALGMTFPEEVRALCQRLRKFGSSNFLVKPT
jgi:cell wall assembly regulator SMI1